MTTTASTRKTQKKSVPRWKPQHALSHALSRPITLSAPEALRLLELTVAGDECALVRVANPQPSDYVPSANHHPTTRTEAYLDSYCNNPKSDGNPRGMSKHWCWWSPDNRQGPDWIKCPYGKPGDKIWVRESWRFRGPSVLSHEIAWLSHEAFSGAQGLGEFAWKSAAVMPRFASQFSLLVLNVGLVRVKSLTDAQLAKIVRRIDLRELKWADNPWVWHAEVRKISRDDNGAAAAP